MKKIAYVHLLFTVMLSMTLFACDLPGQMEMEDVLKPIEYDYEILGQHAIQPVNIDPAVETAFTVIEMEEDGEIVRYGLFHYGNEFVVTGDMRH